jgi:hypothetical protein
MLNSFNSKGYLDFKSPANKVEIANSTSKVEIGIFMSLNSKHSLPGNK